MRGDLPGCDSSRIGSNLPWRYMTKRTQRQARAPTCKKTDAPANLPGCKRHRTHECTGMQVRPRRSPGECGMRPSRTFQIPIVLWPTKASNLQARPGGRGECKGRPSRMLSYIASKPKASGLQPKRADEDAKADLPGCDMTRFHEKPKKARDLPGSPGQRESRPCKLSL